MPNQKAPAENRQERLKNKKKRKWNLVNRGINNGKYGAPVYWTPERNAVLKKLRLEGKTYKQIGYELGKSSDSIRRQWYNIRDGRAQTK
jgi:DNA-binding NarL/FixJ family response regulator